MHRQQWPLPRPPWYRGHGGQLPIVPRIYRIALATVIACPPNRAARPELKHPSNLAKKRCRELVSRDCGSLRCKLLTEGRGRFAPLPTGFCTRPAQCPPFHT